MSDPFPQPPDRTADALHKLKDAHARLAVLVLCRRLGLPFHDLKLRPEEI